MFPLYSYVLNRSTSLHDLMALSHMLTVTAKEGRLQMHIMARVVLAYKNKIENSTFFLIINNKDKPLTGSIIKNRNIVYHQNVFEHF